MAAGYDISASASASNSSATGAVKFGNVSIGASQANNIALWVVLAVVAVVFLFHRK